MKLRITVQGNTYEVDVEVVDGGAAPAPAVAPVAKVAAPAARPAPAPAAPAPAPAANGGSDKVCKAPIPGNIVAVKVKPGQQVKAHDPVVILEAMKMETPINAPAAGTVKSVFVEVGTSVKQGQVLVEFE